jgi:hypothetical protein
MHGFGFASNRQIPFSFPQLFSSQASFFSSRCQRTIFETTCSLEQLGKSELKFTGGMTFRLLLAGAGGVHQPF